jgi:hypothetical protein
MRTHVTVVALLMIILHGINLLIAAGFFFGFSALGALIGVSGGGGAGLLMGGLGMLFAGLFVIIGIPGVVTGLALMKHTPWARIAAIVLTIIGMLYVHTVGISILIGIYSLWVLFNAETVRMFERSSITY